MNHPSPQRSVQQNHKSKLRWFQFSMRTMIVLMLLVCCGLGWLGSLIHRAREQEDVVNMIRQINGSVQFAEPSFLERNSVLRTVVGERELAPVRGVMLGLGTTDDHLLQLKKLRKLQWLKLNETFVHDLSPLKSFRRLRALDLYKTQLSDLSPLAELSRLEVLELESTPVSDLSPLAGLKGLTTIDLTGTRVSDLSPLSGLSGLTVVYLRGAPVSDLSPLAGLHCLTWLDLRGTQVTDLSPLAELTNLHEIRCDRNPAVQVPESLNKVVRRN
jgi:Leucine-rich repeat (LRR) protein